MFIGNSKQSNQVTFNSKLKHIRCVFDDSLKIIFVSSP